MPNIIGINGIKSDQLGFWDKKDYFGQNSATSIEEPDIFGELNYLPIIWNEFHIKCINTYKFSIVANNLNTLIIFIHEMIKHRENERINSYKNL